MVLRRIVIPLVAAYAVFIGAALYALRHPAARRRSGASGTTDGGWRALLRLVGVTTLSGYVALLLIVLIFHVLIAGQGGAFTSAVSGGAFLALVAAAVFVLLSVIFDRRGT
jgi:hypothetical protein